MSVCEIDTKDRRSVKQFVELHFEIYRDIPQWVPPIGGEVYTMLNRERSPYFEHSDAIFLLARDAKGRALGRLAVLDNRRYNDYKDAKTAFFYLFECVDDQQVANDLFAAGFEWARARGLDTMLGPKGFQPLDGLGLLVKGFDHRPAFGIPYNPEYYVGLVEGAGFKQYDDIVSGHMMATSPFPDILHELSKQIQKKEGFSVKRFASKRDLRTFIPKLHALYNGSLEGTTGAFPISEHEVQEMASELVWIADLDLIKIIMHGDDEPAGYLLAYPDVSAAIQRTRGKLLPFGWLALLRESRATKWVNINGAGILNNWLKHNIMPM